MPPGSGMVVGALHESSRELTSVYESWADCLNQDLPDSLGFSGWRVPHGSGFVVRALYECSREMPRVHESSRVLGRLSESGFAGFLGILRMASASWHENCRTSVYESLQEIRHAIMAVTRDARIVESMSESTASGSESIARESTSVYKRLQDFACVHGRFKRCHELRT